MTAKPIQKSTDLIRFLSARRLGCTTAGSCIMFLNIIAPSRAASVKTIFKTVLLGWEYLGTACARIGRLRAPVSRLTYFSWSGEHSCIARNILFLSISLQRSHKITTIVTMSQQCIGLVGGHYRDHNLRWFRREICHAYRPHAAELWRQIGITERSHALADLSRVGGPLTRSTSI
jgi:hypothetical protein